MNKLSYHGRAEGSSSAVTKRGFAMLFVFFLLVLISAGSASAALDDAKAYYAFDEGTGTTAGDSSGNNNDGTITGATWTTEANAKLGNSALSFDGVDDIVVISSPYTIGTNEFSLSLWVKTSVIEDNNIFFYNKDLQPAGGTDTNRVFLRFNEGKINSFTQDSSSTTQLTSTTSYNTNEWYHVVLTRSGSNQKLYINGIEEDFTTSGVTGDIGGTHDWTIGALRTDSAELYYNGLTDEVAVYDRALTTSEISELYNSGTGFNPYAPSATNFSVTAQDSYTSSLSNFSATLENSTDTLSFNTTNGTINTGVLDNSTSLYNITVSSEEAGGYFSVFFENYNLSNNPLNAELSQFRGSAYDNYTGEALQNFSMWYRRGDIVCVGGDCPEFPENYVERSTDDGLLRTNWGLPDFLIEQGTANIKNGDLVTTTEERGGYFNKSSSQVAINDTVNVGLHQAQITFQAANRVSGASVTNFTASTTSNNGSASDTATNPSLLVTASNNFLFLFEKGGWYDTTLTTDVAALENNTRTFEVYDHRLNVTVSVGAGSADANNFTIDIYSDEHDFHEQLSTTTGSILANLTHGSYTVWLNSSQYELINETVHLNSSVNLTQLVFDARTARSFNITFFNETTNEIINDSSIRAEFISDDEAFNVTTTDGTIFQELLTPGEYKIVYNIEGKDEVIREYYTELTEQSFQEIDLYLIDEIISAFYVPVAVDGSGVACQDNTINLLRYYVSENAYKTVGMARTDSQGQAVLRVRPNTIDYKLLFTGSCGVYETPPTKFIDTTNTYTITGAQTILEGAEAILGASTSLNYVNATRTFAYTWTSESNIITQGCLEVIRRNSGVRTTVHDQCVDGNTGSTVYTIPEADVNESTYFARGYLQTSTQFSTYTTNNAEVSFLTGFFEVGAVAPFVAMIVFFAFIMFFAGSAPALLLGSVATLAILSYFAILSIGWLVLSSFMVLAGVILYRLRTA